MSAEAAKKPRKSGGRPKTVNTADIDAIASSSDDQGNVPPSKARKTTRKMVVNSDSDDEDEETGDESLPGDFGLDGVDEIEYNDFDFHQESPAITPPPEKPKKAEVKLETLFGDAKVPLTTIANISKPVAKPKAVKGFDLQALADRVWALTPVLNPLMNDPTAHLDILFWTEIFDGSKQNRDIAVRLNRGDVPEYLQDHLETGR